MKLQQNCSWLQWYQVCIHSFQHGLSRHANPNSAIRWQQKDFFNIQIAKPPEGCYFLTYNISVEMFENPCALLCLGNSTSDRIWEQSLQEVFVTTYIIAKHSLEWCFGSRSSKISLWYNSIIVEWIFSSDVYHHTWSLIHDAFLLYQKQLSFLS